VTHLKVGTNALISGRAVHDGLWGSGLFMH
jgi:hypothetical protein